MSMPADVEVVVIAYRSEAYLEPCLRSVGAPGRTLVIDNASSDRGPEIARSLGCRVVENTVNLGFARAVNQAMLLTTAPFVLFLNPDAEVMPNAVRALREAMEADVAVASARLRTPDGGWQRADWPFPSATGSWLEAFGLHRLRRRAGATERPYEVASVVGACMLVQRTAFLDVGGFDERFWLYGEETDFCRRAADRGWRRLVVPAAVADHVGGASAAGSPVAAEHFLRGTDRFVLHHAGRRALIAQRLALLVGSALRWPLLRLRGAGSDRVVVRGRAIRYCVRTLLFHPTIVPTEVHGGTETVALCSLERWDDVWRRNQLFVRELVNDPQQPTKVLFVEPPVDVLHELRSGARSAVRPHRLPQPAVGMPGVMVLRPRKVLPRVLGGWADASLERQLRRATRNVGFHRPVLWVNDSTYAPLVESRQWGSVYDITDDWLREKVPRRELRRRARRERLLLTHADRVVVCSPSLAADRGRTREVALVTNGVEAEFFRAPQPRPADLPEGRTAIYVGTLHRERIDLDLVESCAQRLPEVKFVFVGPNSLDSDESRRLAQHSNVHLLGPRPYSTVPAYLQHADVCLVPHVVSPFTESLDPIKAYECRSVGVPTVATPVAGFRGLTGCIRTAEAADFPEVVARVLHDAPTLQPDPSVPSWHLQAMAFRRQLELARSGTEERLRAVFVGHTAKPSGGELALVRMVQGLQHTDCHVVLGEDGPVAQMLRNAGATVEVLPMDERSREVHRQSVTWARLPVRGVVNSLRYAVQLSRRLRVLQPDIVHTNTLKAALYGGVAARLARVPLVWHVRDRIADDYLPPTAVRLVRLFARVVPDAVIANSQATLDTLGRLRRMARVVPSPVVYDPLPPEWHRGGAGRNDGFRVVMVGRLAPWKGQDVFLRAFALADLPPGSSAALVGAAMFGEDDFERELHRLRDELGLGQSVTFTGYVEHVAALLTDADVLVHCSTLPEPFGQVVVEGMAAGLAVVASDAGGPREVVHHGIDGLLVPPGDVQALAAALTELAADPEMRQRLGVAAMRRAADFEPAKVGRMIEAVYRSVLSARESS